MNDWLGWLIEKVIGPISIVMLAVMMVVLLVAVPFCVHDIWYDSTHACTKWTEPSYHPARWVGKVHERGGTWSDCVGRAA